MAIYTTKVLLSTSNAIITNFFRSISWTSLMINTTLMVMRDFYVSVFLPNDTSALLTFKKGIFKITSNLVLATRNVS